MTTLRFKPLLAAFALALLCGAGAAQADGSGDNISSHMYCPRGASMYWGIFGYWCEDQTYSGVQPIDCKSGPGQAVGTWNNAGLTPDQLCMQKSSSTIQATPSN
jgi:hypothetical protein